MTGTFTKHGAIWKENVRQFFTIIQIADKLVNLFIIHFFLHLWHEVSEANRESKM